MRQPRNCRICGKKFVPKQRSVFCSKLCWWRSPKGKRVSKAGNERSKPAKRKFAKNFLHTERGEKYSRGNSTRQELFGALNLMKAKYRRDDSVTSLYKILKSAIHKNKICSYSLGKPDAQTIGVEFKVGRDVLRPSQLIFDIVNKKYGKVRWFPSWDSLELTLQGKQKNESLLFNSHLSYLQWCEQEMLKILKRKSEIRTRRKNGIKQSEAF